MPIRRHLKNLYPIDWDQLSDWVRFVRAGGRCDRCKRPHGQTVSHLGDGRWWDETDQLWRDGRGRPLPHQAALTCEVVVKTTKVYLAAAHLNHDRSDSRPKNLRAFCQRCHMLHDKPEHLRQRQITYLKRRALGDLFDGRYF
ncbi:hypothetical protein [Aureimonas phyllosphaerae]|uniref:HNH endonuclease n=1 Tax=Aureimonas phyllosphaerae TaxID=1166078 RepID=A0A7W6BU74_9HYPH|nr:hypothetical protein [Aureimonas phyllosphaerae]MBB3938076.1 hypothetical protein [Aureimonas phyllosphaerae]MBB3962048.1 hypothetical protein [Aureimonas phyllosphaerae]SFF55269.1 hypothetical protein SAMN05216566_12638 [Aureimonas phyllosphaerae]